MHLCLHTYLAYTVYNQRHIHISNIVINILGLQKSAIIAYMPPAYPTLSTGVWMAAYGKYGSNFMQGKGMGVQNPCAMGRRQGTYGPFSQGGMQGAFFRKRGMLYCEYVLH